MVTVMNNKKIFFFDLDGTLLNDEKIITPKTLEALKAFVAAGNHFAINTGRALDSAKKVMEDLKLDFGGCFLCAFNGGQIYDVDKEKLIFRAQIEPELVKEVFALANKYGLHCQTYNDDYILSMDDGKELAYYTRVIKTPAIITKDVLPLLPEGGPSKCIAIELEDHDRLEEFNKEVKLFGKGNITTLYSNKNYLEIFPSNAGKGSAVKRLCEYLGIPRERSYAAGDEQNDISMIEEAGVGVAMLNATDEVKAHAQVVTLYDNNNDGLAQILIDSIG